MASAHHLRCQRRHALHGAPAEKERRGQPRRIKRIQHAPEPCTHAVAEDLLLPDVAHAGFDHADDLADPLGGSITVADLQLRAFLEVDHHGDSQPAPARPGDVGPLATVSDQVARWHLPHGRKADSAGRGCQRASPRPSRHAWAIWSRRANQTPGLLAA